MPLALVSSPGGWDGHNVHLLRLFGDSKFARCSGERLTHRRRLGETWWLTCARGPREHNPPGRDGGCGGGAGVSLLTALGRWLEETNGDSAQGGAGWGREWRS